MATQMTLFEAFTYFKELMDAEIAEGDKPAVKAADYADNTLTLYTTEDKSDATPLTIQLPEEMFLDQAKTKFVSSFAWSDSDYPGSDDPNLEGKPVMVLAVKGDTDVTYSFVSLEQMAPDPVDISAEEGNMLEKKTDGYYVGAPDLSTAKVVTKEQIDSLFD